MAPVTHIVFAFQPHLSAEQAKAAVDRMIDLKNQCLKPDGKTYMLSAKGGADSSPENLQGGVTHAFVVEFASAEDRDYYIKEDPAHASFMKSLPEIISKVQVVDFSAGVF